MLRMCLIWGYNLQPTSFSWQRRRGDILAASALKEREKQIKLNNTIVRKMYWRIHLFHRGRGGIKGATGFYQSDSKWYAKGGFKFLVENLTKILVPIGDKPTYWQVEVILKTQKHCSIPSSLPPWLKITWEDSQLSIQVESATISPFVIQWPELSSYLSRNYWKLKHKSTKADSPIVVSHLPRGNKSTTIQKSPGNHLNSSHLPQNKYYSLNV